MATITIGVILLGGQHVGFLDLFLGERTQRRAF